jgi:ankyrin repeat protein
MKIQILLFCSTIFLSSCSSVRKFELSKLATSINNSDFEQNKKFEYGETLLHKEAHAKFQKPNLRAMQQLIQRGADVNAVDDFGNTPLHVCRDLNAAKLLVKKGANLDARNKQGLNPLDTICNEAAKLSVFEFDDIDWLIDIVEFLLLQGAMFSEKFKLEVFECKRLLLLVLKNGGAVDVLSSVGKLKLQGVRNPNMIKFLCDSGWADVDSNDKKFKTALHIAVKKGWVESVKVLLECGADVFKKFKYSPDKTALNIKPKANKNEIRALLQRAANNPVKRDPIMMRNMPICSIAELKHKMKNPKFDINKQYTWIDTTDYTYSSAPDKCMYRHKLVNIAAIRNDLPYLKYLIKNGAYFKPRKNESGKGLGCNECHPLFIATSPEFVGYLLQKGVSIDEPYHGNTLLLRSTTRCDIEMVRFCLRHGANINALGHIDNQYDGTWTPTALELACCALGRGSYAYEHKPPDKYLEIIKLLLEGGAMPKGPEAMCYVVKAGCLEALEGLLQHGTNIEWGDAYYSEYSMYIGQMANYELYAEKKLPEESLKLVKFLVEHGLDVNKADPYGQTALSHAVKFGDLECIEYLLKHGANIEKAKYHNQTMFLRLFHKLGADVKNAKGYNQTLWQVAARQKNAKKITALLRKYEKLRYRKN